MFGLTPRTKPSPRHAKGQAAGSKDGGEFPAVGRRVRTLPKGLLGVVRWVGPTHFSAGVWVGVELDTCDGRNDGEVQGTRYFTCSAGHGVFVRPDNVSPTKEGASTAAPPTPASSADRRRPNPGGPELTPTQLTRRGSHASLVSENVGGSGVPSNTWVPGSECSARKALDKGKRTGSGDDPMIGQILASETFSRILSDTVAERVKTEMARKEFHMKADSEAMLSRMSHVERVVEDAGGAMDDIASMVQTISESVEGRPADLDLKGAAAGGVGGGDAGGGGRDDARVAELTKLLCTVHDMSSQAAELLRAERKQNQDQVKRLTERVQELETRSRGSAASPKPMEG
ncbi:similar to dynactin [Ectocarpus siliculosus]|uniref:Similar to dynactin n=1 Tax=Ectocarpus siliculosus TaxID=2880 RepID=D8LJ19_ECTSI|nr:similar to dynactin [Ectocarpus siliculosus]|eukprot:CBN76903.1 similar to dynactin [Ectocarpus siliculosus]